MTDDNAVRPTKKQRELLDFIEQFINQHGYSPSYREIMNGCGYNSIATVAVHINNLISRGHLRKRDHSARSLELTRTGSANPAAAGVLPAAADTSQQHAEAWLLARTAALADHVEQAEAGSAAHDDLQTVVRALELLGMESVVQQLATRNTPQASPISE